MQDNNSPRMCCSTCAGSNLRVGVTVYEGTFQAPTCPKPNHVRHVSAIAPLMRACPKSYYFHGLSTSSFILFLSRPHVQSLIVCGIQLHPFPARIHVQRLFIRPCSRCAAHPCPKLKYVRRLHVRKAGVDGAILM